MLWYSSLARVWWVDLPACLSPLFPCGQCSSDYLLDKHNDIYAWRISLVGGRRGSSTACLQPRCPCTGWASKLRLFLYELPYPAGALCSLELFICFAAACVPLVVLLACFAISYEVCPCISLILVSVAFLTSCPPRSLISCILWRIRIKSPFHQNFAWQCRAKALYSHSFGDVTSNYSDMYCRRRSHFLQFDFDFWETEGRVRRWCLLGGCFSIVDDAVRWSPYYKIAESGVVMGVIEFGVQYLRWVCMWWWIR